VPHPLDEFPIHQAPVSLQHVGSTDRNFYDRCYFNAHRRDDSLFFVSGYGVYPNLGVTDAYATVRMGDRQWSVRFSDALDAATDRLHPTVGPYRLEVIEPLRTVRVVCDADEHGLGFDMTWEGLFPAVDEQPQLMRVGPKAILDTWRFAQLGRWSGVLRVDGEEIPVDPSRWIGSRDRSWGIRPVGDAEPAGRNADEPLDGFWWLYVPVAFDDFAIVVIVQEQPDGFRTLNDATRVWGNGRHEQLGWPRIEITYRSGTRDPEHATIHLSERDGTPLTLEVDALTFVALNVGAGYGGDPEWGHGQWRGRGWAEGAVYDLTDPAIAGRVPFSVVDHVGRAVLRHQGEDDREGWGLFEHGTFGRHDPSGFADWGSVAD
jgi:hypothetical protein